MSQALPVLPQLPVLDGRKPDLRPVDAGNRQTFGKLLDRFAHRDVAKDTAKERTCEPAMERRAEAAAEADARPENREDAPTCDTVAKTDPAGEMPEPVEPDAAALIVPAMAEVPMIVATVVEPLTVPVIPPGETQVPTAVPSVVAAAALSMPQQPVTTADTPRTAGNAAPTTTAEPGAIYVAPPTAETAARVFVMDGAAAPVAQPRVLRAAATVDNQEAKPVAASEDPAPVAAPADAALARTPAARTTPGPVEPADLSRQIRLDGRPTTEPAAALADPVAAVRDERAPAPKTPEQQFAALIAVDTPRSAAAQYHRVAETVRMAAAETPSPADQVSIRLLHAVAEGRRTIQMHLHPAELGTIDVKMQWQGDRLTAQFQVDRPETLQLLQREVPALERTLNQAGVSVDSGSLSFSLRQQTGNGQNGNGQPFDPAAAGAAFGEAADLPLGDEPLGQVIRDGLLSIRV